jgi:radical SAM superfamily enzyme YgiQ (UPF0313 family)
MEKKLLLFVPRDPYLDDDRVMPPLGVLHLKSYIEHHGITCDIDNDPDYNDLSRYVGYDFFGISATTPQWTQAHYLAKQLKIHHDSPVILGGPYATYYTGDAFKGEFDFIVKGDGEKPLLRICSGKSQDISRILEDPLTQQEMNDAPLPYRSSEFLTEYNYTIGSSRASTILTGRGCPYSCGFCEHACTTLRLYSPSNVGRQIDQVKECGFSSVMFFDDVFAINSARVKELCDVIIPKSITFRCFVHSMHFSFETAYDLREAGCVEIGFGAESGSQLILDNIHKRTTIHENYDVVNLAAMTGLKVKAFLILGLPGESYRTIAETEEFIQYLMSKPGNDFDLTLFYPYKGTRIRTSIEHGENKYDLRIEQDELSLGYYKGKGGQAECLVSTSHLTREQLQAEQQRLLKEYRSV